MIKSMTGFASVSHEDESGVVGVTVRSVNHRYLDVQLRLPSAFNDRETALRAIVQKHIARGRVEISVSTQARHQTTPTVEVNGPLITALHGALAEAREQGLVSGPLTPGDLLRLPQALTIRDAPVQTEPVAALADAVERSVDEALLALDRMRVHEGQHLRADLESRRHLLASLLERLAGAAQSGRAALEARLKERVAELTTDIQADKTAIAQEIVRTAARSDISEEVTRFTAHLAHWDALSDDPEPCGRKLDFLLQEMNREINTIGSKADGVGVSELIVATKAELEKMREQVQNVE
jgi:uncharacterized protein (TIGR00255 family)